MNRLAPWTARSDGPASRRAPSPRPTDIGAPGRPSQPLALSRFCARWLRYGGGGGNGSVARGTGQCAGVAPRPAPQGQLPPPHPSRQSRTCKKTRQSQRLGVALGPQAVTHSALWRGTATARRAPAPSHSLVEHRPWHTNGGQGAAGTRPGTSSSAIGVGTPAQRICTSHSHGERLRPRLVVPNTTIWLLCAHA
jgi:hypothetical protein